MDDVDWRGTKYNKWDFVLNFGIREEGEQAAESFLKINRSKYESEQNHKRKVCMRWSYPKLRFSTFIRQST